MISRSPPGGKSHRKMSTSKKTKKDCEMLQFKGILWSTLNSLLITANREPTTFLNSPSSSVPSCLN